MDPLSSSRQLIVVNARSWDSTRARMSLHEKRGHAWTTVKDNIPVVTGKKGLAWGKGLSMDYGGLGRDAPAKREGDGKTPAGIFTVGPAFGFPEKMLGVRLPYVVLTGDTECVDDEDSQYYNRIVSREGTPNRDWKSSEKMAAISLYRVGLVVEHNMSPPIKGCGSCIFFHVWEDPHGGTAGCTAMSEEDLTALLLWLDPSKQPLLIQLTDHAYKEIARGYNLP